MTIRLAVKHALSSTLRPLALFAVVAVPACDAPDAVDAPEPQSGEAWIAAQLEAVKGLTPQEQAEHFAGVADDFAVAKAHSKSLASAPTLDLASAHADPESEQQSECFIDEGCVDWSAEAGCTWYMVCYGCTNGDWGCVGFEP